MLSMQEIWKRIEEGFDLIFCLTKTSAPCFQGPLLPMRHFPSLSLQTHEETCCVRSSVCSQPK